MSCQPWHSVTLSLATLNVVQVAPAPIEALIAASIVMLAAEVATRGRRDTLIRRAPWLVTTIFGLFHGLGFAGALREIGLPHQATVPALAAFNVGVELGQVAIVCASLLLAALLRRAPALDLLRDTRVAAYPIGLIAAFWTIERVVRLLAGLIAPRARPEPAAPPGWPRHRHIASVQSQGPCASPANGSEAAAVMHVTASRPSKSDSTDRSSFHFATDGRRHPGTRRMHIIFVSNKRGLPRRLDLKRPLHVLILILACVPPLLVATFIGNRMAVYGGAADSDAHVAKWRAQLAEQGREIEAAKQKTAQDVAALGQQVGTLHAEVIRLDALGARLVKMASLDRGEFDFSQPPAVGGPLVDGTSALESTSLQSTLDALAALLSDRERQLDVLEHFLLTQKLENRVEPRGEPVDTAWISSYFGRRNDPFTGHVAHHQGIDFAGRLGSPVKAVADGVVSWSGPRSGYGNMVEVNHGNGLATRYGHNSKNLVAVGDQVERGEVIALIGATGRATGPHLHFEVLQDGRAKDPMAYIRNSE